jgi:hypothetical protein
MRAGRHRVVAMRASNTARAGGLFYKTSNCASLRPAGEGFKAGGSEATRPLPASGVG